MSEGIPVVLSHPDDASGLAEMLHQFLEQTVAESPYKLRQARRLMGEVEFRAAEDDAVAVRMTFEGNRIGVRDVAAEDTTGSRVSAIRADFLTIAHLTAGQESPLRLLAQRKLRVRFSLLQLPFLLRVLRFMRIETPEQRRAARLRWVLAGAGVAIVVTAAAVWYASAR